MRDERVVVRAARFSHTCLCTTGRTALGLGKPRAIGSAVALPQGGRLSRASWTRRSVGASQSAATVCRESSALPIRNSWADTTPSRARSCLPSSCTSHALGDAREALQSQLVRLAASSTHEAACSSRSLGFICWWTSFGGEAAQVETQEFQLQRKLFPRRGRGCLLN